MTCARCGVIYTTAMGHDQCSTCRGVACRHCGRPKVAEWSDCGRSACKRATTNARKATPKVVPIRRRKA